MAFKPVYQLNTPHCTNSPGKTCGASDCAVCCVIMAHDFATNGKIRPTQKQVRQRPSVPDDGGLTLDQVAAGILEFKERYTNAGWNLPYVKVYENETIATLNDLLTGKNNNAFLCIVFIDNGKWVEWCKSSDNKRLAGDLEYDGKHAVILRWRSAVEINSVKVFNPLYDGRKDAPTGIKVAKGPQRVPYRPMRLAIHAASEPLCADFVVVGRATRIPDVEPPTEPCDDATEPSGKPGRASNGAV